MDGFLIIDKPAGITSARVVDAAKRSLPRGTKLGHAGTLDPFATGVLLLLVGKATRQCEALMDQPKSYEATVKFGSTTATDDLESDEVVRDGARAIHRDTIDSALHAFRGTVMQRPPAYSAIKVGGRRAYDLARKGRPAVLEPRPVRIDQIDVMRYDWPLLDLVIDCGRGTYIRAIARDLGEALGVGGYLTRLRRTRVGEFGVDDAVPPSRVTHESIDTLIRPLR